MPGKKKPGFEHFDLMPKSPISDTALARIVPELQFSPGLTRAKIRKNKTAEVMERFVREVAPQLATEFMKSLMDGTVKGDKESMRLAAEVLGLTQKSGGVQVNVNQMNNNNASSGGGQKFDSIARELEAERAAAREKVYDV